MFSRHEFGTFVLVHTRVLFLALFPPRFYYLLVAFIDLFGGGRKIACKARVLENFVLLFRSFVSINVGFSSAQRLEEWPTAPGVP